MKTAEKNDEERRYEDRVWTIEYDPLDLFTGGRFTDYDIRFSTKYFPDGMLMRHKTRGMCIVRGGKKFKMKKGIE